MTHSISQRIADGVHQAKEGCATYSVNIDMGAIASRHPRVVRRFELASAQLARTTKISVPQARGVLLGLFLKTH